MIKTFLLSNIPEFREMLQIENTECMETTSISVVRSF